MPDPGPFDYLLGYLDEFGPAIDSGEGILPVSYQELRAWSEGTKLDLSPFEMKALHDLSRQYVRQYYLSEKMDEPAPFAKVIITEERRNETSNNVKNFLLSMMATQKGKRK